MYESDLAALSADFEVLIIGGGAAGLAAALTLGRLRRKVLLCDDQQPRNQAAAHMNNFPGYDGVAPEQWRSQVRLELQKYPSLSAEATRVIKIAQTGTDFKAQLTSGRSVTAQKVLLAYGMKDRLPDIPNLAELWGKTAVHCPFCHGFEFQDQALALLGDGEMALHLLSMLLGLSENLMLLTDGLFFVADFMPATSPELVSLSRQLTQLRRAAIMADPERKQQEQELHGTHRHGGHHPAHHPTHHRDHHPGGQHLHYLAEEHLQLLRKTGFAVNEEIWRNLNNAMLLALNPG